MIKLNKLNKYVNAKIKKVCDLRNFRIHIKYKMVLNIVIDALYFKTIS
jgi:hypothetical protein